MIMETVRHLLDSKNIKYIEGENILKFDVEGERGNWQSYMRAVEEENLLVIYSLFGYKVEPERIQDVALLLTDINFGLKVGNFEMDRTSGEIHFKTYLGFMEEEIRPDWIEKALFINIHTMDHYLPQIIKATAS